MAESRYMRLRRRTVVPGATCSKPGCTQLASWWGATIPDGRLQMCEAHKTNHADELLESLPEPEEIPDEAFVWRLPKELEDRIEELRREGKTVDEVREILKKEGRL